MLDKPISACGQVDAVEPGSDTEFKHDNRIPKTAGKATILQASPGGEELTRDRRVRFAVAALLGVSPQEFQWPDWLVYGNAKPGHVGRRIRIVPSGFFGPVYGKPGSLPILPLRQCCGVPVLFGLPDVEKWGDELVVANDIIAGTYFMMTRYEELIRGGVRDKHGRFPGRESTAYKAGFLGRPIVDEYLALLCRWLATICVNLPPAPIGIQRIYLTHNVLRPWAWGTLGDCVRAVAQRNIPLDRHALEPFLGLMGICDVDDPNDCFDWMLERDMELRKVLGQKRVESVFFVTPPPCTPTTSGRGALDKRMVRLIERIAGSGGAIGLHSTRESASDLTLLEAERKQVEEMSSCPVTWNRHQFLKSPSPETFRALGECGITDDFSIGHADVAGFRVGTCRPYRWFDPVQQDYCNLTIHPVTVMDCTLDRGDYMGLSHEGAWAVCKDLLHQTSRHGGEVVLIWHNTEVTQSSELVGGYQRRLYSDVLAELRTNPKI